MIDAPVLAGKKKKKDPITPRQVFPSLRILTLILQFLYGL